LTIMADLIITSQNELPGPDGDAVSCQGHG
jgi:hypothetical protein